VPLALLDHNAIGRLMTAVHCGADEPWLFEPRCRNIKRRALVSERMPCQGAGQVAPNLKAPWHGGAMQIVMSPLGCGSASRRGCGEPGWLCG